MGHSNLGVRGGWSAGVEWERMVEKNTFLATKRVGTSNWAQVLQHPQRGGNYKWTTWWNGSGCQKEVQEIKSTEQNPRTVSRCSAHLLDAGCLQVERN